MKKLLGASLSVAIVYGLMAPAQAEVLKNLQINGELEMLGVKSNNLTDFSKGADDWDGRAHTRVLVNGSFDLNEDASAMITMGKTDRNWGASGTGSASTVGGSKPQTITDVQGAVEFDQAYVNLKNVLGFDHRLGRQFYGEPGDLLVYFGPSRGPGVRTLPINSIDAWTGSYNWDNGAMHAQAIVGKMTSTPGAYPQSDTDVRGVEVSSTKMENMKLEGRLYDAYSHTAGDKGHLYTLSPRVSGKAMDGNLGYKAEVGLNFGNNNPTVANNHCSGDCSAQGYGLLADVDYSMPFMGKLKLMGELGIGSGGKAGDTNSKVFVTPASDYRPGDIFGGNIGVLGGYANVGGLGGINGAGLTVFDVGFWHDTEKWPKLGWGLSFYDFSATEKNSSPTGKAHIGDEIDLRAKWTHSDKLSITAGLGTFTADVAGSDSAYQAYLDFHLMF